MIETIHLPRPHHYSAAASSFKDLITQPLRGVRIMLIYSGNGTMHCP